MITIVICVVIVIAILVIATVYTFINQSTDSPVFDDLNGFIANSKVGAGSGGKSIFIDVYTDGNDTTTGRDARLAIVYPFNWYILNSHSNIYVHSVNGGGGNNTCPGAGNKFIKLKNPVSGHSLQNVHAVCLPVTISSMILHFIDRPKIRLYMNAQHEIITVIDVINYLLTQGAITNFLREENKTNSFQ